MYIETLNGSISLDWKIWSVRLVWKIWLKYRTHTGAHPAQHNVYHPPTRPRTESIAISQKLLPCSTASQLYQASAGCVPSTVAPAISNTAFLPGDKISVVVVDHFYCCCWGAGIAQWLERRTRDWKVPGSSPCMSGGRKFFSRSAFCALILVSISPTYCRSST